MKDVAGTVVPRGAGWGAPLHALVAAAIGVGTAFSTHAAVVATFMTGVAGLVAILVVGVVAGVALAVTGVLATGRRAVAWLGLTTLVLLPAVLVPEVTSGLLSGSAGDSGEVDLSSSPLSFVAGAVVAVAPALVVHPGRARVLGLVTMGVLAVGVTTAIVIAVVVTTPPR
ncbi:hypothetical protein [Curtobacterium sp. 9128]|uniref:hypothetical protein n=1 Tax=Curtobacterium sp. 9128 TaxID=1793722 RepID=UPI0011A7F144|nr:hypothetical protein [Curtobacterium sp. 9128]